MNIKTQIVIGCDFSTISACMVTLPKRAESLEKYLSNDVNNKSIGYI